MTFPKTTGEYDNLLANLFFGADFNNIHKFAQEFIRIFYLMYANKNSYEHTFNYLFEDKGANKNGKPLPNKFEKLFESFQRARFQACRFQDMNNGTTFTLHTKTHSLNLELIKSSSLSRVFKGDDGFIYKFINLEKPEANMIPVFNEIVIQKLLSLVSYVNHNGETVNISPDIYTILKCNNRIVMEEKDKRGFITKVRVEEFSEHADKMGFLIKMQAVSYSFEDIFFTSERNLIPILQDFLAIQESLVQNNILFNHCDMKHDNIMYNDKKQMQWIDFGTSSISFLLAYKPNIYQRVTIYSPYCMWFFDSETKIMNGYYQGKDILQFILTLYLMKRAVVKRFTFYDISTRASKEFIYHVLHMLGFLNVDEDGNIVYSPFLKNEIQQKKKGMLNWGIAYNINSRIRTELNISKVNNPSMKRLLNLYETHNVNFNNSNVNYPVIKRLSNLYKTRNVNRTKTTNNLSNGRRTQRNNTRTTQSFSL